MRRKPLALLAVLLLFSLVSLVRADDWISGQVTSVPTSATLDGTQYWQFNFTVDASNGTETGTTNLTCIVPYLMILGINLGSSQNMTGTIVNNGTETNGDFLVSGFLNSNSTITNGTALDFLATLKYIWGFLGGLGNMAVTYMQTFIQNYFNVAVPSAVLNTVFLVAIALVWWYARRLPWFVSIILFVVAIGLASNLITTMQLM